jgi:hypothetical protein
MTEEEALNFIRGTCVLEGTDEEAYKAKWLSARRAVEKLKKRSLWPIEQRDIPQEYNGYLKELCAQDAFKNTFGANQSMRQVEIGRLVAFQRNIDIEYATELASKMKGNEKFLLETCLPLSFQQNIEVTFDQAVPAVLFSSLSPKLTFSGIQLTGVGGPELSIGGQVVQQPGALFLVGTQVNYVQAVEFHSRLFLMNGYHRAYAALLSGWTYIPAVIRQSPDFAGTGAARPGFFPRELLMSDAPPLLQDFRNDEFAADVRVRSMRKAIRIRVDDFFLPR